MVRGLWPQRMHTDSADPKMASVNCVMGQYEYIYIYAPTDNTDVVDCLILGERSCIKRREGLVNINNPGRKALWG